MMTAASIAAGQATGYSAYLESRTVASSRGDYYLSPEGERVEAPGVWHALPETLERLGLKAGAPVSAAQLVALMEGRDPRGGEFLRRAGADGRRAAGIDMTFSAPKSVSVLWAVGSRAQRVGIEDAHARAVSRALAHLRSEVPIVRRGAGGAAVERARDVIAAEYRHTTARGVAAGEPPDPQLHSHVLVTGVVRLDGEVAAVSSRPIFRSARELGAFYRAALADELRAQGYSIDAGTGRDARYFELHGVPAQVRDTLSGRSREVWLAAERFRARYGRAPERGELRNVKLENRRAKTPQTRADLDRAWRNTAARTGLDRAEAERLQLPGKRGWIHREHDTAFEPRLEAALTAHAATFSEPELRASALEQAVGEPAPERIAERIGELRRSGRVVDLQEGYMTTAGLRAAEQAIERRIADLARARAAYVSDRARAQALAEVAERIGGSLSVEQRHAVELIAGERRAVMLVGEAGAGKGVVIDAAARAEQLSRRETIAIAVAGAAAERLGHDCPSLAGRTMTLDALLARTRSGSVSLDRRMSVYFDEAAMADTKRLDRLTELVASRQAKLILIGDSRQLPAIGAGGMFERLAEHAPVACLSEVYRTSDRQERDAWRDLRSGHSERAMAHYRARGQLHLSDTRQDAMEHAVRQWAQLTERLHPREVALMSDASTLEIERLNARAQQLRAQRGELGRERLVLPRSPYALRVGDRVTFISQHRPRGSERVENGTRGEVTALDRRKGRVVVRTDGAAREVGLRGEQLEALRLGYAQHLYRQQGATAQRAVVVTGGWQTSREGAYVEASRARGGTDWHVSREDLGTEGTDPQQIERLAEAMRASRAQPASLKFEVRDQRPRLERELERSTELMRGRDGLEREIERGLELQREREIARDRTLERGRERDHDRGMEIDL
jgi:conjugative relaxase-like TrwC/TraI family protein